MSDTDSSAEHVGMDPVSKARLTNTIQWASKAMRECYDLAYDASVNPGFESLEDVADEAGKALERLLAVARAHQTPPALTPEEGDYVEYGVDVPMPHHLDLNAGPLATCTGCGRSTWCESEVGLICGLPQPSGAPCEGNFSPGTPSPGGTQ